MLPINLLVCKRRWNFLSSSINLHANQLICYFPVAYLLYMHLYSSKTNPNPILSFWPYGRRSRRLYQNRITDSLIWSPCSVRRGNYIWQKKAKESYFRPMLSRDVIIDSMIASPIYNFLSACFGLADGFFSLWLRLIFCFLSNMATKAHIVNQINTLGILFENYRF